MSQNPDDLDAVRVIAKALELFEAKDQERIIRWAREKLGLSASTGPTETTSTGVTEHKQTSELVNLGQVRPSIRDFIKSKAPQNDNQLVATVAYYYRFVAPEAEGKQEITRKDIENACRLANVDPPKRIPQTLVNAHSSGLLDKGSEKGAYAINTVGENLVVMTMPTSTIPSAPKKGKTRPKKPSASKTGKTRPKK